MGDWWAHLTPLNQVFFCVAFFFSVLFLWQLISALIGLGGDSGTDMQPAEMPADTAMEAPGQVDADVSTVHSADTLVSFKLLSVRSIIAFGLLFGWAGALYLQQVPAVGATVQGSAMTVSRAIMYSLFWALGGMFVVSGIFYLMKKMTETGNVKLITCVGKAGTVYMNIPTNGTGQIRTVVSGTMCAVGARTEDGQPLPEGTPVQVVKVLDSNTVIVRRAG
jgi:hypothetical protein